MKNLILPTEIQVKKDIEQFLFENYASKMNLNLMPQYLKEFKDIALLEFHKQNIEFNQKDFFRIYNLYTQSNIFFSYLEK